MPNDHEFLSGFGLIKGVQVDGYELIEAESTHQTIKRYQEYEYQVDLTFENLGIGSYNDLYRELSSMLSGERTIYGVRNPYRCIIDPIQNYNVFENPDKTITFELTGHSYRA